MSPKVLGKAGESLADVYDVKGSIAGVEQLESRDVGLVHEMGGTIFSERLRTDIIRGTLGALAQNITTDNFFSSFFLDRPSRILGLEMITTDAARLTLLTMSLRTEDDQEIPIWAWENGDPTLQVRFVDGGSSGTITLLLNQMQSNTLPSLLVGDVNRVPRVGIHQVTAGFGAGTVTTSMILHTLHTVEQGVSSHGLPLPSW